ncbi:MAG TPA: oligosaccharide flippase family protein [Blastocatellia bacterium]|nr:oligosaccharide flippase family protein [Blastocatellia bacterium]
MTQVATDESKPAAQRDNIAADNIGAIAGRGAIYITAAKLWFMASGYGIAITLTYLLTPENYGIYKVVINAVSIINAVIVTGTYQTVSRYIAQEEAKADSVKAKALALQVYVGGAATLAFFLLAPVVARFLNDSRLTNYLRLASLITLSYAFFSVYTGYFNGQKRFLAQASLDAAYSTLKLTFIVAFVWMGFGVMGAVGGFALAASCVLALSALVGRGGARKGEVRPGELFKFQSYLLLFTFVLTLLQKVDVMLIKSLSSPDPKIASENVGFYGASIDVANLTYQIIISVTFVIFPLVSRSTFEADRSRTQLYISNTLRYSIMIMALTATLFSANASEVLRVIYREAYQAGAGALSIVAFGMLFFGLLYVLTTIISASGHPRVSLLVGVVTLGASVVLNAVLIPRFGLVGAASATTVSMLVGVLAACAYLGKEFGALMPLWSAVRIAICAGAIYGASLLFFTSSKLLIIAKLVALSVLYLVALIISREVGRDDLRMIRRVIRAK